MNRLEIYYDFAVARRKANQLENQARQLRRIANNSLYSDMNRLKRCWHGESCNSFLEKGDKLITEANLIADSLVTTAHTIRSVTERTYHAELNALELARTKNR